MAIRSQFDERLNELHQQLLTMGTMVEEAVYKAVKSLTDKDVNLAKSVVEYDKAINDAEIGIEKTCFTLIALQQPVGSDLRRIATTLKVATDLERMADHAVSIAKTTLSLKDETYAKPLIDIPKMGQLVQAIVRDSLGAYIQMDHEAAVEIAKQDDIIDDYFNIIFTDLIELMGKDKNIISQGTHLLLAAQYLERIGDYATNICEWIVYMSVGKMVELN
ncbi:phosphate signaling complex protein PhoU [Lederbergia citrea]|uniref:Phosphate-specific transport system accessory protein PhoU n=1 Tax=Lederbergia citrea TaxID=2833581 RepID=A0A942UKD4_9BACI|nr:phosphate signaling complex protein PhoU [Lederbergia citrea]MBS4205074.1 phosphate signaling complex protein PhoU [Lederbergia citrea]MBS4223071.1 phosphate signaling complex protein PhoU [Lederbergia citrea]